ncbi:MAG: ATP-dependent DNA ligase [Candidatus Asgardarchaeia archaeon]
MENKGSFYIFAEACEKIEKVSKRNDMIYIVSKLLDELPKNEVPYAVVLLSGYVFPPWENKVLNISWSSIAKIISKITKVSSKEFSEIFSKSGDVGQTVKEIFELKNISPTYGLFSEPLSILELKEIFCKLAELKGKDSQRKKLAILEALYRRVSPLEAKYITKILLGELRIGLGEGLLEIAIAKKFNIPLEKVQYAHMLYGDLGSVMKDLLEKGRESILNAKIQLLRPLRPMLADMISSEEEILEEHGGITAVEYKLDGARIQIHKKMNEIRIFTRRLTDVTDNLPELVSFIEKIPIEKFILEGEIIAVSPYNGKPYPFQYLMRRFRRLESDTFLQQKISLEPYFFDVLLINDQELLAMPYLIRRHLLENRFSEINTVDVLLTNDPIMIQKFFKEAIKGGHEGLVAKAIYSKYHPGKRKKLWLKLKRTLEPLDVVIVAAQYGYGRRVKWLSDYYLAVRDPTTNEFLVIGKTFKGLTDEEFEWITKELLKLKLKQIGPKVYVQPKIVVEVIYDEIQKSPQYKSGYALRFARIKRIRLDKSPNDIDTIDKVKRIYEEQFKHKAMFDLEQ